METNLSEISFTYYDKKKYILHTSEGRYFIISNEKKKEMEKILNSDDLELREELLNKINSLESKEKNSLMYFADFQFKKTIIPKQLMSKICNPFKFMFNEYVLTIIAVFLISFLSYSYLILEPNFSNNVSYLKYSWGILFLVFFVHELGHAQACVRFNVKAGDVGFGITSFLPVLYANVTDAWRLSKKERIIVNLGGIYFQNLMSLCLLIFSFLMSNMDLYFIAKIIFISTVFQFFPFHKSDGYWILSDVISQPNLFKYSREIFQTILKNPFSEKDKKIWMFAFYYILINGIIYFFVIRTGVRFWDYIINMPFYLYDSLIIVINKQWSLIVFDINYIWAIMYLVFTSKMILNNIKSYTKSKGADKVE